MSDDSAIKRNIKDSVFSALFGEEKYLRQLCRVLKPDVTEEELDSIRNVTIKNILVNGLHNDLSFEMGDTVMYFCEAQSSPSYNMPFRELSYAVEKLKEYVVRIRGDIYAKRAVRMPVPMFYMVYTGTDGIEEDAITLTDTAFGGVKGSLEAEVTVIHPSGGNNIVDQYIKFSRFTDEQVKKHGRDRENMEKIIEACIKQDVLKEFLEERKAEVIDMMDLLFNEEYAQKIHLYNEAKEAHIKGRAEGEKKGRAEGEKKGRAEGEKKGILTTVSNMMKSLGLTAEKALLASGVPQSEWNEYLPQLAG